MAKQKHLTNAPIVEAIIDFRGKLPNIFQAEELSSLKKELPDYPKIEGRRRFKGIFKPTPEVTEDILQGYFFKTEDEKNIAQFRIDGFTFNRLKPYTNYPDDNDEKTEAALILDGIHRWSAHKECGHKKIRAVEWKKGPIDYEKNQIPLLLESAKCNLTHGDRLNPKDK